jgi:hypothetical protein
VGVSELPFLHGCDSSQGGNALGTTWTIGGAPPGGSNEVGTNHLANATIETFVEGASPSAASANCFSCHLSNTVQVSHVYGALKPLP